MSEDYTTVIFKTKDPFDSYLSTPGSVQTLAQRVFGLKEEDFDPAHVPQNPGSVGHHQYFEIRIAAQKAESIKGHFAFAAAPGETPEPEKPAPTPQTGGKAPRIP